MVAKGRGGGDEPGGGQGLRARESYESAVALAVVILLWSVSQALAPPFLGWMERIRQLQMMIAGAGLIYFAWTWRHPVYRVAIVFSLVEILTAAVLIPWMGWTLSPLGRQWQPIAAAQLALASLPLVVPANLWVGCALVGVFATEMVVIFEHQLQLGLAIPAAEPFFSLLMAPVGIVVLVMREQRRRMVNDYVRTESETATLAALRPLLSSVREQLHAQVAPICEGRHDPLLARSVNRLRELDQAIGALEVDSPVEAAASGDRTAAERLLLARDSQVGATLFAVAALAVNTLALWSFRRLPLGSAFTALWIAESVYAATLAWLLLHRLRPSPGRGVWASLLLFVTAVSAVISTHIHWARLSQPADPYIGHKLLLVGTVLIRPPRLWLGLLLVGLIAVEALALHFLLAPPLGASSLEPWHTLLFIALGFGLILVGEQRRIASVKLLRAETTAASLRRRAALFLALCDQLNTPLQTLMLRLELLAQNDHSSTDAAQLQARVNLIQTLSRQLQQLAAEVPTGLHQLSLEGARALRPRVS